MTTIIIAVIVAVAAFVGGVLVGRKNASGVNTVVSTAKTVAADASNAASAVKAAVK